MEEDGELYLAMDNFRTPALNSRFNNRQYNENAHPGPPYPPVGHTFPSPTASYPVPSTQPFLDRHTQAPQHNQALSMMGRPPPAPQPQRTNYSQVNLPSRSQNKSENLLYYQQCGANLQVGSCESTVALDFFRK